MSQWVNEKGHVFQGNVEHASSSIIGILGENVIAPIGPVLLVFLAVNQTNTFRSSDPKWCYIKIDLDWSSSV